MTTYFILERSAECWHFSPYCKSCKYVKIGRTSGSPEKRRQKLQTGNPKRLELLCEIPEVVIKGRNVNEAYFHGIFASERKSDSEWFDFSARVRRGVDALFSFEPFGIQCIEDLDHFETQVQGSRQRRVGESFKLISFAEIVAEFESKRVRGEQRPMRIKPADYGHPLWSGEAFASPEIQEVDIFS